MGSRSSPIGKGDDSPPPAEPGLTAGILAALADRDMRAAFDAGPGGSDDRGFHGQSSAQPLMPSTSGLMISGITCHFPGPLEGHQRPSLHGADRLLSEDIALKVIEGLEANPQEECNRLLTLTGFFSIQENTMTAAAKAASSMAMDGDTISTAMTPLMFLAWSATRQNSVALSDAVADRCIREARSLSTDTQDLERSDLLFRILLAASTAQPDWNAWLATRLITLALTMPPGPWHGHLAMRLSLMKQLLPATEWIFGRAIALARLADRDL